MTPPQAWSDGVPRPVGDGVWEWDSTKKAAAILVENYFVYDQRVLFDNKSNKAHGEFL